MVHDEGNNPDAAFKKLTKMSMGLEQCNISSDLDAKESVKPVRPPEKLKPTKN